MHALLVTISNDKPILLINRTNDTRNTEESKHFALEHIETNSHYSALPQETTRNKDQRQIRGNNTEYGFTWAISQVYKWKALHFRILPKQPLHLTPKLTYSQLQQTHSRHNAPYQPDVPSSWPLSLHKRRPCPSPS